MKLRIALSLSLWMLGVFAGMGAAAGPSVEVEEEVYRFESADNGAGPMWCHGSTCLGRVKDLVFASGLETLPGIKPLNNCRWALFCRDEKGWQSVAKDPIGRTREPCPLAVFNDGRLFLSVNPTMTDTNVYAGPARPEILEFSPKDLQKPYATFLPVWKGAPPFSEHSYRSFAADSSCHDLVIFQNIGYTHAEWTFRDARGKWSAAGQLKWPWGADYEKLEPIRVCYPNVSLRNRAVHFCGVSDIIEPKPAWRAYKKQLTGRDWDYDFRRLFYTWTKDITKEVFADWVEIASREETGGWISPGDMWVADNGLVHILWTERAIDERLREKFFPQARQSYALNYAQVRDGKVTLRKTILESKEGGPQEVPGRGRFQVTPDAKLWVIYYVSGKKSTGQPLSENRLVLLKEDGSVVETHVVPLRRPFTDFFTASTRGGSQRSKILDLLGTQAGGGNTINYARIRLP